MVTRITDVIVPEVFQRYMMRATAEKARIFQSGILEGDGQLAGFLAGGGRTVNLPHWNDLSGDENISSDNPASVATPLSVSAASDVAIRHSRNQGWSSADLVQALAGDDPLAMVVDRVSTYWANQLEKAFVASIQGVLADNIANDSGDMVNDQTGSTITAEMVIDTAQTMGDAQDALATIVMHSKVYAQLAKLNLIDFIPDSNGVVRFPTYLGYNVIRDDDCKVVTTTGDQAYTYLVGRGAFAWGEGTPRVPVEVFRHPAQGDGGGVEELWSRREFVMHPRGFAWLGASMAGESPTNTELENAANWNRVAPERKQVKVAALISDVP